MKLYNSLKKDILSENFSRRDVVIYGILAPLVLIAGCILVNLIELL